MPSTGPELGPLARERSHGAAVGERPVHGEVDAVRTRLQPGRVERAGAVLRLRATARRALVRKPRGAFLEQEQLDAAVRRGLERLVPAGCGTAAPARLLLPALERGRLLREPRLLEERQRELEQLGRRRVSLAGGGAGERSLRLLREHVGEAGARLLRPDDDDVPRDAAANVPVEVGGNGSEVIAGELVDVPLEARLRPATLVVTSGLLLGQIRERLEPSVHEPEEQTALAVDDGDDRSLAAAEQRNERPEVEVGADAHAVRHRLAQSVDAPELVEPRGEDGDALRAGAVEVVREEVADALEVGLQPRLLVVRQLASVRRTSTSAPRRAASSSSSPPWRGSSRRRWDRGRCRG